MMSKEFNFEEAGKAMPYRVPPTFFAASEEKIMASIRSDRQPRRGRLLRLVAPTLAVAATLAIMLSIALSHPGQSNEETVMPDIFASASLQTEMLDTDTSTSTEMDAFLDNMSDEELSELMAQVNGDIFLF